MSEVVKSLGGIGAVPAVRVCASLGRFGRVKESHGSDLWVCCGKDTVGRRAMLVKGPSETRTATCSQDQFSSLSRGYWPERRSQPLQSMGRAKHARSIPGAATVVFTGRLPNNYGLAAYGKGGTCRLSDVSERVRVVTIGPALRRDASRRAGDRNLLILPEPTTDDGVLAVVRSAGFGIPDEVLRSIAAVSAHDLRLAIMLVQATRRNVEFRGLPITDLDGVWRRLMDLFRDHLGDTNRFRDCYEILSASIDIERTGRFGDELGYLADYFQVPRPELERAMNLANQCGLGFMASTFFEAVPRALAVQVFQEQVWERIRYCLDTFHSGMPMRLRRRFVERCQECEGVVRGQIQTAISVFC